jgi:predicted nucleic acid-binding protein
MVTMADKVFVDTNILLRGILIEMNHHEKIRRLLRDLVEQKAELWISGQIIREFIVQATHPRTMAEPLSIAQVREKIAQIHTLYQIADDNASVRQTLLELLSQYPTSGKQVHDANLVATMLAYQIDTLFTLNIADFKRFDDKIKLISIPSE